VIPTDSVVALAFGGALFGVLPVGNDVEYRGGEHCRPDHHLDCARGRSLDPVAPAVSTALAASVADALPVSTPPNAIVYASGRVRITTMLQYGIVLDTIAVIVVPLVVLVFTRWVL
jgi:hypothetical protein